MEAFEFVNNYPIYIEEIGQVIRPELQPVLKELRQIDQHDLVRLDSYFDCENSARGYVLSMFLKRTKYYSRKNRNDVYIKLKKALLKMLKSHINKKSGAVSNTRS